MRCFFLILAVLLLSPSVGMAQAPAVELRPIDRATVRIIALDGIASREITGARSGARRVVALGSVSHGSGVVVSSDGLVLTARHVVEGAEFLVVISQGAVDGVPARVVFVDPDHDLAFLRIPGPQADVLPIPAEAPALAQSQRLSASGYPLAVRERFPAATSGELSRVTNDGLLQSSMSLNPGNSGGPVIDADGRLVGIASMRGDPSEGVEGVALLEPIAHAMADQPLAVAVPVPPFGENERAFARLVAHMVIREATEGRTFDAEAAAAVERLIPSAQRPEERALLAAVLWDELLALLEDRRAASPEALTDEPTRTAAQRYAREALTLCRVADGAAPYLRARFPFVRAVVRLNPGR